MQEPGEAPQPNERLEGQRTESFRNVPTDEKQKPTGLSVEERKEEQEAVDEERIEELQGELQQQTKAPVLSQDEPEEDKYAVLRQKYKDGLEKKGIVLSNKFTDEQVEEMGREVISGLNSEFPQIEDRLDGAEKLTFLIEQTSFNDYIFRRIGLKGWFRNIFKHIPFQAAGLSVGDRSYINGGLPNFLIKRTMYHEYLHNAAHQTDPDRKLAGVFGNGIEEGATEYYARQAAAKEGVLYNVMNPFYFPNAMTYGLMSRSIGSDVLREAYFNGRVEELKDALINKWGSDSWERVYDYSSSLFGLKGVAYAAYKSLTTR